MAMTEKMLGQGRYNDTADNTLYTATGVIAGITALHICNTTAADVTCQVYYVPSGDTKGLQHAMLYDFTILANDYHSFSPEKPHYLDAGDFIVVQNSVANALTFTLSGVEIT